MLEFYLHYVSLAIGAFLLSQENSRTSLPFWGTERRPYVRSACAGIGPGSWLAARVRGGFVM